MKHEVIKGDSSYPFKTRQELLNEDTIYPIGCWIQVKGENMRYIADGEHHFKDLKPAFEFSDDMEISSYGGNWIPYKKGELHKLEEVLKKNNLL